MWIDNIGESTESRKDFRIMHEGCMHTYKILHANVCPFLFSAERSVADEEIAAFVSRSAEALSNLSDSTTIAYEGPESLTSLTAPLACTSGPQRVIHTQGNILFWPLIIRKTCDGLRCNDPKCLPRSVVYRTATRYAYRIHHSYPLKFEFLGYRTVRYADHIGCRCQQCSDFKDFKQCHCQKRCPNVPFNPLNQDSYCLWREARLVARPLAESSAILVSSGLQYAKGSCTCCRVPRSCRNPLHVFSRIDCRCQCRYQQSCPPNKYFDQNKCSCQCPAIRCLPHYEQDPDTCKCICKRSCPSGSYLNKTTCECVGACSTYTGSDYCEMTRCEENQKEYCRHISGRCQCPSQEPQSCSDITDRKQCQATICPNQPELTCRYNSDSGCYCPCCHPRTNPSTYNCDSLSTSEVKCSSVLNGSARACNWVC